MTTKICRATNQFTSCYKIKLESSEKEFKEKLQNISPIFTEEVIDLLFKCFKEMDKNSHEKRLRILEAMVASYYNLSEKEMQEIFEWKRKK